MHIEIYFIKIYKRKIFFSYYYLNKFYFIKHNFVEKKRKKVSSITHYNELVFFQTGVHIILWIETFLCKL